MMKKFNISPFLPLTFFVIVAFFVRLVVALDYHKISPDGVVYLLIGKHIISQLQYTTGLPHYPAIIQPPLFPLVVGFFQLFVPLAFSGQLVSVLAGSFLIIPVFFLSKLFFGPRIAYIAAGITIFHPALIEISAKSLTEAFFIFLIFSSLYFMIKFLINFKTRRLIASAVGLSLAYLTRIETLAVVFMWGIFLAGLLMKRKLSPRQIVLWLTIIIATVFFYAIWSSYMSGRFMVIPKLRFIEGHRLLYNHYLKCDKDFRLLNQILRREQIQYGLSQDKSTLAAYDYFYNDRLPDCTTPQILSESSAFQKISNLVKLVLYNGFETAKKFLYDNLLPIPMIIFLILGLFSSAWTDLYFRLNTFLVFTLIGLSLFLFSHVEKRFLISWVPILIIWMARGVDCFSDFITGSYYNIRQKKLDGRIGPLISLALVLIFMSPFQWATVKELRASNIAWSFTQKLPEVIPEKSTICSSRNMHALYFHYVFYRLPFASYPDLLEYLHKNKVQYLILEAQHDKKYRPQIHFLFNPDFSGDEHLQKIKNFHLDNDWLFIYRVR